MSPRKSIMRKISLAAAPILVRSSHGVLVSTRRKTHHLDVDRFTISAPQFPTRLGHAGLFV